MITHPFLEKKMSNRVPDDEHGEENRGIYPVGASGPKKANGSLFQGGSYGVHKVNLPPKQSMLNEVGFAMKETFFHDDPWRKYKNQPRSRKLVLWLQSVFPILEWGREYNTSKFKGDLISGLTLASLVVPQDIGYAKLANLAPEFGLHSSFVPPLVYAVMGSSRELAMGPVAVVSLLLGTMLQEIIDPVNQQADYQRLAFTATFFAGLTQFALGFFRLGFLIDFLSHAAIVGFMAGAAITISLQQLKGLLGIKKFTKKTDIISVMHSVFSSALHGWNWQTIVIGVTFLIFLVACKYIGKKHKRFFWVSAIAPLVSVIISTFAVRITHAEEQGVQILNHIDGGVNPPSLNEIFFTGKYVRDGFRIGAITGLIGLTEAVAIGRTFAEMKGYQLDGNKEMIALGTTNMVGSMTSCYVVTGGFARTAVNKMAGCSTPMANIVMSTVVLLALLVITPLFKYTPNAILSSIIISAVVSLIDTDAMILIWKIDKLDFIACMGAFFGVIFVSVEIGLLIAVAISFAKLLYQVTRPKIFALGKIPETIFYRNIQQYPEAIKIPRTLIVKVDSAIYFSNSNYIKERILRFLVDEEDKAKEGSNLVQYLIVEMSTVSDIDTSGIHALEDLNKTLQKKEIELLLSNPGPEVIGKLYASDLANVLGHEKIFLAVEDAVRTCSRSINDSINYP